MIFVDVDGVLADHDGEYRKLTGGDPKNDKGKVRRDRLAPFPHFYANLPVLPGAMELWSFLRPYHPSILSAASNFLVHSREDKKEWVEHHLGLSGARVIVTDYPKDKQNYAKKGDILIDDRADNCAEWEKAGGIAVHYTNAESAIQKLKTLLYHQEQSIIPFAEFIKKLKGPSS